MICDIRCEVGFHTVIANNNAIFLVTKLLGAKPQCTVFLVQHIALFKHSQRIVNTIRCRQTLFRVPAIKHNAEFGQIILDVLANRLECLLSNAAKGASAEQILCAVYQGADMRFLVAIRSICRNVVEHSVGIGDTDAVRVHGRRDIVNVLTAITGAGEINARSVRFQPAQPDTEAENVHLSACVIDVVFAIDVVACSFKQVADRSPVGAMPTMTNMQRPRRVG